MGAFHHSLPHHASRNALEPTVLVCFLKNESTPCACAIHFEQPLSAKARMVQSSLSFCETSNAWFL